MMAARKKANDREKSLDTALGLNPFVPNVPFSTP